MSNVSNVSVEEGNTITSSPPNVKRQGLALRWCFTWNNYNDESMSLCLQKFSDFNYIIGYEVGESGTPHLQGYVECKKKVRPIEFFKLPRVLHWESAKGDRASNIAYCSKGGKYETNMRVPKPLKLISKEQFYPWQFDIYNIIINEPDDRLIYWYWETTGNVGKSSFCKYLCAKHDAIVLSGKSADMKYGIIKYHEKHGFYPELLIFDIPRTSLDYIAWAGLEDVKNGCFFSNKYESDMVIMNSPHIICFANAEPDYDKVSVDRWRVINIGDSYHNSPTEN